MGEPAATNSDLVRAFMDCMTRRDLEAALGYLTDDIVVWEPPGLPYGGTFSGHDGFRNFTQTLGETWRSWRDGPYTYADVGDVTFKENAFTARSRTNGRTVQMHLVEVFTFRAGRIASIRPHYWDVQAVIETLSQPAIDHEA